MTAHTSSMLSAPSSPVIWMVSGPVGVGDGVVVAAGVAMAGQMEEMTGSHSLI